jgi:hypothetical protein
LGQREKRRWPYVTISIVILCLVIHYFQDQNRATIDLAVINYCESIHDTHAAEVSVDYLRVNTKECREELVTWQQYVPFVRGFLDCRQVLTPVCKWRNGYPSRLSNAYLRFWQWLFIRAGLWSAVPRVA